MRLKPAAHRSQVKHSTTEPLAPYHFSLRSLFCLFLSGRFTQFLLQFKKNVFFGLKIFFTFTISVDPDEMLHYAAFHLGLHCY